MSTNNCCAHCGKQGVDFKQTSACRSSACKVPEGGVEGAQDLRAAAAFERCQGDTGRWGLAGGVHV